MNEIIIHHGTGDLFLYYYNKKKYNIHLQNHITFSSMIKGSVSAPRYFLLEFSSYNDGSCYHGPTFATLAPDLALLPMPDWVPVFTCTMIKLRGSNSVLCGNVEKEWMKMNTGLNTELLYWEAIMHAVYIETIMNSLCIMRRAKSTWFWGEGNHTWYYEVNANPLGKAVFFILLREPPIAS